MTDLPSYPDAGNDTGVGSGRESPPGMPRWVKASGIIALVLILLLAGIMLFGRGNHGPGRHAPPGGYTLPLEHVRLA